MNKYKLELIYSAYRQVEQRSIKILRHFVNQIKIVRDEENDSKKSMR